MILAGIVMNLVGFAIAVASLGVTESVGVRMAMVLAGIGVCLASILLVINGAYLKNALWKK
jgi:hypothetical protein